MKLARLAKVMVFITVLSLIYIHLQMQIFDLAYEGKVKEKVIRQLKEDNGNATYTILKLKSSNHLGCQVLTDDSDLEFFDSANVVRLEAPQEFGMNQKMASLPKSIKKASILGGLFSLTTQAQAHPQE